MHESEISRRLDHIEWRLDFLIRAVFDLLSSGNDKAEQARLTEKLRGSHDQLAAAIAANAPK